MAVRVEIADVTDATALDGMLERIASTLPPLSGVIHAAGALSDAALRNQAWDRFADVLWPKLLGAWHLHRVTQDQDLDLFVLFSSVTGVLGSPGQANHAAANAFLDQLARHRRALGLPAQSIAWGAWSGLGEAEDQRARISEQMASAGIGWMTPQQGLRALDRLVRQDVATAIAAAMDWRVFAARMASPPAMLDQLLPAPAERPAGTSGGEQDLVSQLRGALETEREALLLRFVQGELQAVLRLPSPPEPAVGFFDLGMDSLMAVEFRNRLNRAFGGSYTVSSTAVFDYPDSAGLARHLAGELGVVGQVAGKPERRAAQIRQDDPVAVVGMACRFPGGSDLAEFWSQLEAGGNAVTEGRPVPVDSGFAHGSDGAGGCRWGAFVSGIDLFDAEFFRIAPVEARLMDPQQRMLLETSWQALEEAGIDPARLRGSRTGVFAGIASNDYRGLVEGVSEGASDLYAATGNIGSTAIGRIAFALGLEGPAIAVDTACSSSLVAVHQAVAGLQRGEADLALAGGVNAILSPDPTAAFWAAGMLAADGRCKTFDASATASCAARGAALSC